MFELVSPRFFPHTWTGSGYERREETTEYARCSTLQRWRKANASSRSARSEWRTRKIKMCHVNCYPLSFVVLFVKSYPVHVRCSYLLWILSPTRFPPQADYACVCARATAARVRPRIFSLLSCLQDPGRAPVRRQTRRRRL